jgi:hypothetical protein
MKARSADRGERVRRRLCAGRGTIRGAPAGSAFFVFIGARRRRFLAADVPIMIATDHNPSTRRSWG